MKNFSRNWIIFSLIGAVVIGFPFFTIRYFEIESANSFLLNYLLIPLLLGSFIYSCWFYPNLKPSQDKKKTKARKFFEAFFSILLFGSAITAIIYGMLFSLMITINTHFGNQQKVFLRQPVLRYNPDQRKNGRVRHYIKIVNPKNKDTINLEVYKKYEVGELFEKEMFYGSLDMLYSKR